MQGEVKITHKKGTALAYKKAYKDVKASYLNRIRWAVTLFYFAMGLNFATWASRIPDIKTALHLSEGDLGTILFCIPVGQLCLMPFSGRLAVKYGSHRMAVLGLSFYILALISLGLAQVQWQLSLALFFFGMCSNLTNISVNTQGIYTEGLFGRAVMSSFHGAWSTAGFTGALIGIGMKSFKIDPFMHFVIVGVVLWSVIFLNYRYLIKAKSQPGQASEKKKLFAKPDTVLLWLGAMSFCCMLSEGIMFDWSGVYFTDVIKAEGALGVLGYASFMAMMATGRFMGDIVVRKIGRKKMLIISGCFISTGLYIAVLLPYIVPATLAFMMVGLGVSTVVPSVYSIAGRRPNMEPSIALQTVSSVSFLGFMLGPPVIGHVAHLTSLRISFAIIGVFGFLIAFLVYKVKAITE
ncbi:MFS transporter [Flavobacterium sp. DG1-102-2]|uniref:MFS transporter n=1 Tax=Flavobacterium sp. DG1-102-2 TaxID=3081663 RepID=UPI00294989F4|nr:MFS transporter [Flavobacterium sp. DG1-102-2]MDV6167580.1 MFS transporter [Flavobacterium sp. DG1-102-2]